MISGYAPSKSVNKQATSQHINPIDPSHKSQNASGKYPTIQHFVTEMCTHVHISVTKWCIVGYGSGTCWDLCDRSIMIDYADISRGLIQRVWVRMIYISKETNNVVMNLTRDTHNSNNEPNYIFIRESIYQKVSFAISLWLRTGNCLPQENVFCDLGPLKPAITGPRRSEIENISIPATLRGAYPWR